MPTTRSFQDVLTEIDDGRLHEQLTKLLPRLIQAARDTKQLASLTFTLTVTADRGSMVYSCPRSRQWLLWTGQDGKPLSQDAFAAFIEDNLRDIVSPVIDADIDTYYVSEGLPAAVLEMARNPAIHTTGTFQRTIAFNLGIPVFDGGPLYRIEARIRFSLVDGRPSFRYDLFEAARVQSDAFAEVRERVRAATGLLMLAGAPEA